MVPKPFPFPFNVGTDICSINRIADLLRQRHIRERFVRRIFTRLEWAQIWKSFERVSLTQWKTCSNLAGEDRDNYVIGERYAATASNSKTNCATLNLPDVPGPSSGLGSSEAFDRAVKEGASTLGELIQHLGGRWAAKEAVIKAHAYRQLFMHEVSIINPRTQPSLFLAKDAQNMNLIAMIDPPCNTILMDERVAQLRSLRGFNPLTQRMRKGPTVEIEGRMYHKRRSKVIDSERQMAKISISHDREYATAVCIALDQPLSKATDEQIVDEGKGLPLHEPSWGDEGWLDQAKLD